MVSFLKITRVVLIIAILAVLPAVYGSHTTGDPGGWIEQWTCKVGQAKRSLGLTVGSGSAASCEGIEVGR